MQRNDGSTRRRFCPPNRPLSTARVPLPGATNRTAPPSARCAAARAGRGSTCSGRWRRRAIARARARPATATHPPLCAAGEQNIRPVRPPPSRQVMDSVEAALGATPGPYFLSSFGLVDCTFAPFLERIVSSLAYYKGFRVRGEVRGRGGGRGIGGARWAALASLAHCKGFGVGVGGEVSRAGVSPGCGAAPSETQAASFPLGCGGEGRWGLQRLAWHPAGAPPCGARRGAVQCGGWLPAHARKRARGRTAAAPASATTPIPLQLGLDPCLQPGALARLLQPTSWPAPCCPSAAQGRWPNLERWFEAMEARPAYAGFKSDHYTHVHDLPPQLGGCVSGAALPLLGGGAAGARAARRAGGGRGAERTAPNPRLPARRRGPRPADPPSALPSMPPPRSARGRAARRRHRRHRRQELAPAAGAAERGVPGGPQRRGAARAGPPAGGCMCGWVAGRAAPGRWPSTLRSLCGRGRCSAAAEARRSAADGAARVPRAPSSRAARPPRAATG